MIDLESKNIMEYLIEVHCHTSETSPCSAVRGAVLADIYKAKNYHAITVTDHYTKDLLNRYGEISWKEKIDNYLSGYRNAKKRGDEIGVNVLLGIELRFTDNYNDYLVFGLDEQFLYDNPEMYNLGIDKFSGFARANNLLFIQAHPFRNGMVVINHDLLDGIEVHNAHQWHNSRNHLAQCAYEEQSQKRPFVAVAGSDCHELGHEGRVGIFSDMLPKDGVELAALLRSGEYKFYKAE
jgi:predicted metal-dependent phosphoesterase TrpH